jgi:NtrC-family two-component system response regulator AlgB
VEEKRVARILVVDDEDKIRTLLAAYLRGQGHHVGTAADGSQALRLLPELKPAVVFTDVRMPGIDGLELLREIRHRMPQAIVVLITAYATIRGAVEAMRDGAYDYLVKPFDLDEVGLLLERALELDRLRRENAELRGALERPLLLESANPAMRRVLDTVRQAAAADVTVLLTGESGTGKNVLAGAIHAWSPRRNGPFAVVSCTALAEHLLESELFGHVRGAFTGAWKDHPGRIESAAHGTVFLDEVGELPLELQAKLLRFLDEKRFERVGEGVTREADVRIVAATNRDLAADVRAGVFRQDLYFRLNVIDVHLPPLRERPEDLPGLIEHALGILGLRHRRGTVVLDTAAREALLAYRWPGNVRELMNVLERAVVLSRAATLHREDLPDYVLAPPAGGTAAGGALSLDEVERNHVRNVLAESASLEEAATRLGINVTTLWRKRRRWGLD